MFAATVAQVPNRPPTYMMNSSTIIMPCNNTGYTDPATTIGWGVVDFGKEFFHITSLNLRTHVQYNLYFWFSVHITSSSY